MLTIYFFIFYPFNFTAGLGKGGTSQLLTKASQLLKPGSL